MDTLQLMLMHEVQAKIKQGSYWVPYHNFKQKHPNRKNETSVFVVAVPKMYTIPEIEYINKFFDDHNIDAHLESTHLVKLDPVEVERSNLPAITGSDDVVDVLDYMEAKKW